MIVKSIVNLLLVASVCVRVKAGFVAGCEEFDMRDLLAPSVAKSIDVSSPLITLAAFMTVNSVVNGVLAVSKPLSTLTASTVKSSSNAPSDAGRETCKFDKSDAFIIKSY